MSHLNIDVDDFLLITIYPVIGLFIAEVISRRLKVPSWSKLVIQGIISVAFAVAYITIITAHWLTSTVLFALAITLFYQARRAKIHPDKSIY
jgi:glucose-6-phosphate-specific signal transduction histidine kinase